MTYKNQLINGLKQGFLFYAFSTILIAIQFSFYIVGSPILDYMDFEGWVFFAASCVSHASQFALVPYLLGFLVLLCRFPKTARVVQIVGVVLLCVLNYLNSQVYAIYHFHINGFVLSMVFGEGAGEIFNFDALLYLKEAGLFAIVAAIVVGVWYLSHRVWLLRKKAYVWLVAGIFVGCTLYAHLWHIYAAFYQHQSVMKSATLLPYYFPTTSNGLLLKWGCKQPRRVGQTNGRQSTDLLYPVHQLETVEPDSLPNIVVILLDSWNRRRMYASYLSVCRTESMVCQSCEWQQWYAKWCVQPLLWFVVLLLGEF